MHAKIKVATLLLFGVFWPITLFAQAELTGQITHVRDGDTIYLDADAQLTDAGTRYFNLMTKYKKEVETI